VPLGMDYAEQECSLARALEQVGERWTLLIVRDCFFGVRRFTDFQAHLDISRAVLAQRLTALVDAGLLARVPRGGREEYELTARGEALWPALLALTRWGEAGSDRGPRRIFAHVGCGTDIDASGRCPACATAPGPRELEMRPGPAAATRRDDPVSRALRSRHRLLQPLPIGAHADTPVPDPEPVT
jgi:DNA-binding HxlR family transcriptional regulator